MSQQRARKASGVEGRRSLAKGSGDSPLGQPKQQTHTRCKIPKSLRYDLDNALVGLCDVWFEEIKPHLVRNNIKVHVHGAGAASGDHSRLPPGAPGCAHLDPGAARDHRQRASATCADCCSTQPTASRARCRRPPAPRPRGSPLPPPSSVPPKPPSSLPNPWQTSKPRQRRPRKSRRSPAPAPPIDWRTPRLCRTYSMLPTPRQQNPARRTQTAKPLLTINYTKRKPTTANKSTQTPVIRRTEWSKPVVLESRRAPEVEQSKCSRSPEVEQSKCSRCPASTTLTKRSRRETFPTSPLFKDDLIDILAENKDKQLKLIFKSPPREDSERSFLNLMSVQPQQVRERLTKKLPWR